MQSSALLNRPYFIYGPGALPVEQIAGATTTYLHHDQLGSTHLITDAAGSSGTATTNTYQPYGAVSTSGSLTTPLMFSGQYLDTESGLYYLRARYYDPATAQFLTVDPAVRATHTPLSYVLGNPLNTADPTGLDGGLFDLGGLFNLLGCGVSDVATWINENPSIIAALAGGVALVSGVGTVGAVAGLVAFLASSDASVQDFANGNPIGGFLSLAAAVPGLGAEASTLVAVQERAAAQFWDAEAGRVVSEDAMNSAWNSGLTAKIKWWRAEGWASPQGYLSESFAVGGAVWDSHSKH
jgi:RHS repeat-associated protein